MIPRVLERRRRRPLVPKLPNKTPVTAPRVKWPARNIWGKRKKGSVSGQSATTVTAFA